MDVLLRNNVRVFGPADPPDPRPMVFAHGFGCDQNMWRLRRARLRGPTTASSSSTTSAPAAPTSSAYDPTRYDTLHGYADDVLEICRELELRDVVFVGHSVSAMIGVLAAVAEPERFGAPGPRRAVAPLHRRRRLRGRLRARGHRRAAGVARQQLPRLVERDGAGDHGQRRTGPSWARS